VNAQLPIERQAAFAAAIGAFALLRWQAARLGARLVGRHGLRLRRRVRRLREYVRLPSDLHPVDSEPCLK